MPRLISVIDSETDPFKKFRVPKPFIWGYYNGADFNLFKRTNELAAFLSTRDEICYAHNGGKFDFHFLLQHLTAFDDVMIVNGRLAQMHIGKCELRDSYMILPVPLAAYKKDEIDYAIMERGQRGKPKNREKIRSYLRGDCVYLYELINSFVNQFGLHLTQAGASMKQWEKICNVVAPRTDAEFYAFFSPYYYGGRVQCFEHGIIEENFHVYDINSAYPDAMLQMHPSSAEYQFAKGYIQDADFVKVRCVSRGAFPFRGLGEGNSDAGLHFPEDNETREYTVTGWEYRAAKDTETIEDDEVIESIKFFEHADFKPYILHFYAMRLRAKRENNAAESLFAKLLMNSLYGKFAANPDNYSNYILIPPERGASLPGTGWNFGGELGPWILGQAPLADWQKRFYNVATGASITGYVRAKVWRAICASKGVLYCDTDAIAARQRGHNVNLGDGLGAWSDEGEFDKAGIAGKKLYIFRGVPNADGKRKYKTASKGVRLTNAQLWAVAAGAEVEYIPEVPTFSVKKAPVFTTRRVIKTAKG